jgi:glyoxylase-like metal-dependent hydrolase (beta-lactamase superfamily II)
MSYGTWKRKPRPQFAQFIRIEQEQQWFTVFDIGYDILAICEPYHFQEVISYLVKGKEKALLIDTGMGYGDMRKLTSKLWEKEIIVVNTHSHFDHIGSNYQFDLVHVLNDNEALNSQKNGKINEFWLSQYDRGNIADDCPIEVNLANIKQRSYEIRTIENGEIFDLGARKIKCIATPGHSSDSIMLVDQEYKLLFTGDSYYPAVIYAHFVDDIRPYQQCLLNIGKQYSDYLLVTSHNEPYRKAQELLKVAEVLKKILDKEIIGEIIDKEVQLFRSNGIEVLAKAVI